MPLTEIKAIDVTAYGAADDGTTDDTNAIQDAVDAALSQGYPAGIYIYTSPRLYFPPGRYKISSTINFGGGQLSLSILGDDAIIEPASGFDDDTFAFHTTYCYNFRIKGVHFVGFAKGLFISNDNNLNTSQASVEECIFQNNEEALRLNGISTIATISKCKFFGNTLAMFLAGDKVTVRDCWMESGELSGTHPAQIINHSILTFESNLLVPEPPASGTVEPAWINNYLSVKAQYIRQGGEPGSFTLINNFAGSDYPVSGHTPNTVSVKDSECYAVYGNDVFMQPAIVRYVDKVPNCTIIRNNMGLIDCRLVDFSYELYGNDATDIANMIANSGAAVPPHTFVEVVNNEGGVMYAHSSYVPLALYPFFRNSDSMWPSQPDNGLKLLDQFVDPVDGSITFTFDYGPFNVTHLLNYTGNPNFAGSAAYSGGYVGLIKANGFWTGAQVDQMLLLEQLFSQVGNPNPGAYPTGTFGVTVFWEDTGTVYLPNTATNHNFCIKVSGRSGPINSYDTIKVTPLYAL